MTTLAQFYASVSAEIRRGNTLDSLIESKARQALRWMEGQHTFLHMEHYASLVLSSGARSVAPPTGFKKMGAWRIIIDDSDEGSSYFNISKVDFYDVSRIEVKRPSAYWQDGKDYFWLDNTPDQDYNTEMAYTGYTVLPSDTSQEPYVIQNYESLLLSQTMVLFAPQLRDPNVLNLYKPQRDEMMKSSIDADVEERQSWQSESVQYGAEFREDINSRGDQP